MPTGYTAAIADGISFEQFALDCARAFGALITMRDEPAGTPIPERFEPSDYYRKAADTVQAELARLTSLSTDEAAAEMEAAYRELIAEHEAREKKRISLRKKYEAMMARVHEWVPPTDDHKELKAFMLKQIKESIEFDCSPSPAPELPDESAEEWLQRRIKEVSNQHARHLQEDQKERARTRSRNEWVAALRKSLEQHQ